MRELVQLNSDAFCRSATVLLRAESDPRGCRYLLTLLWTRDLLLPVISNEKLPADRALAAGRVAAEIDPQLHIRITRYLIANTLEQQTIGESEATKLLQILAAINDSVSLQPFVRQMLLHPSARIRSKVSLLVGRSQSGNKSLATLLSDPDARVRANAVEALWNNPSPEIGALVRLALDDANNRVVGNAILGLYAAGQTVSISAALKLTTHPDALFRATAAWAMGKMGDPRFLPSLGRMLADSAGQLRKTVFHSIASLKRAAMERAAAPPLCVAVLDVARKPDGKTRITAVVTSGNPAQPIDIQATGFVIETAGLPVTNYSCTPHASEKLSLALAVPSCGLSEQDCSQLDRAVKSCVYAKRVSDQWAISKYSTEEPRHGNSITLLGQTLDSAAGDGDLSAKSSYSADPIALARSADSKSSRFEREPDLLTSLRRLIASTPSGAGPKHLVAIIPFPHSLTRETFVQLIQAAKANRLSIHAICLHPHPEYFQLCRETGGFYREADAFDNVPVELEIICSGVTRAYKLDFQNESDGGIDALSLEVHLPSAVGKTYWCRPHVSQPVPQSEVA